MPDVLKLTPSESVEVLSSTSEALEVEATYGPAGSPPPRHFHPALTLAGSAPPTFGLCDSCVHQQLVPNTRGSVFSLCLRSRTDPRYPRYPRAPVSSCPGHTPRGEPQ